MERYSAIITGNYAMYGGAIYEGRCDTFIVTGNTMSNNTVQWHGGAMYLCYSAGTIAHNIIHNNSTEQGAGAGISLFYDDPVITDNVFTDASATISYNDVWNNAPQNYFGCSEGTGDISLDPRFVNPGAGDYHLQATSPCIDTGDDTAVPAWLTTDFEYQHRIWDGDGDTTAVVDMGADELAPANAPPNAQTSPQCEGQTNPTDVTDLTPEFS